MWNRVYACKGTKEVESTTDFDEKEHLTVLAGGNAAGFMLRPFILFDGKVQLASRFEGTEDKVWIGVNNSGYIDNPNFTAFVVNELIPAMTADKVFLVRAIDWLAGYSIDWLID